MSEYNNNLKGALWKHEQRHDKDMVLSGDCEIDGQKYFVNVFRNTSTHERSPAFDLTLKIKDSKIVAKKEQKDENIGTKFDEDIPF